MAKANLSDRHLDILVDEKWLPMICNGSDVFPFEVSEQRLLESFLKEYHSHRGVFCSGYWSADDGIDEVSQDWSTNRVRVQFYLREGWE